MPARGRPKIDLEEKKDEILRLQKQGTTYEKIASQVGTTERTLKRRLEHWGIRQRASKTQKADPVLRTQVAIYFASNYNDTEMVSALSQEGICVHKRQIEEIRKSLGLRRRLSAWNREQTDKMLWDIIQKELDSGSIEGYGRGMLYTYFKKMGHQVSRDTLFGIVSTLDPVGLERRTYRLNQLPKGEYVVPGPNYLWSIDGHDKLKQWGIEIYGGIDAYSRYIPWIYVGISNKTTMSVLVQYLTVVKAHSIHPHIIRSDHGVETPLCAEAHYALSRTTQPDISFYDVYFFGKSTRNVRIEAWWGQLEKTCLYRWRDYFLELSAKQLYSNDRQSDRIALLAIFMPIIRKEVLTYVEIWNNHRIRKQKRRPNLVSGKPRFNYFHSGVQNWGMPVDPEFVDQLLDDTAEWDSDEYLPAATLQWCSQALASKSIDLLRVNGSATNEDGTRLYTTAYAQLQELLRSHINSGMQPELMETPSPSLHMSGYRYFEQKNGAVADMIRVNAQTMAQIQTGGEIRIMHVEPEPEDSDSEEWTREDLEENED